MAFHGILLFLWLASILRWWKAAPVSLKSRETSMYAYVGYAWVDQCRTFVLLYWGRRVGLHAWPGFCGIRMGGSPWLVGFNRWKRHHD